MKIWKHSQIRLWSMIPRRLRSSTSRRGHSESLLGYPWNVLRLTICQTMQKFSRLVWIPLESQWDVSRIWFQWSYNLHELRKALGDPLYDHWNQIRARLRIQKNHTHTISNQNCFFFSRISETNLNVVHGLIELAQKYSKEDLFQNLFGRRWTFVYVDY